MDPDATYWRWRQAVEDGDWQEAKYAQEDLMNWLSRGGFDPRWTEAERVQFMDWDYYDHAPDTGRENPLPYGTFFGEVTGTWPDGSRRLMTVGPYETKQEARRETSLLRAELETWEGVTNITTRLTRENPIRDDISTMDLVVFGGVALVSVGIVAYAYIMSKTAASAQAALAIPPSPVVPAPVSDGTDQVPPFVPGF